MVKKIYDLIVVGAGPAGVTAAIYARKSGLSVLLINGENLKTNTNYKIDNHYGFHNGILYRDLAENGIKQAIEFEVDIINETCYEYFQEDNLQVCVTKNRHYGKTLVIATGIHYGKLPLDNFDSFVGNGIHFCTLCDGFLFRNKKVLLFGYGKYLIHEYEYLKEICRDITIYATDDDQLDNYEFDHPVIKNSKITKLIGNSNNKLSSIVVNDTEVSCDGLFIALGSPNSHSLATTAGIKTTNERIVIDDSYQTNLSGIFAIGDAVAGETQVARAIYEGMKVANQIYKYINDK